MGKRILLIVGILIGVLAIFGIGRMITGSSKVSVTPTPTPATVEQLPEDKRPQISLAFTADGHYVTVNIENIYAAELEYNLIYDASVKKSQIQTGVTGGSKLDGKNNYAYKQLLGSESSGKFTYHESIKNAVMELTLRDSNKYSIFSATYPFEVTPGETISLTASD